MLGLGLGLRLGLGFGTAGAGGENQNHGGAMWNPTLLRMTVLVKRGTSAREQNSSGEFGETWSRKPTFSSTLFGAASRALKHGTQSGFFSFLTSTRPYIPPRAAAGSLRTCRLVPSDPPPCP